MTGTTWVEESVSRRTRDDHNTHSVGVVRDAVIQCGSLMPALTHRVLFVAAGSPKPGRMAHDINGFHVKPEHAIHALDSAHAGAVEEGSVARYGHDMQRLQGRHRYFVAATAAKDALHGGGARTINYGTRDNFASPASR